LPIWMEFMRAAIANKPDEKFPEGNAPKKQLELPDTPQSQPEAAAPAVDDSDQEPAPNPVLRQ